MFRKALESDLPKIVDIYNQAIIARHCTADTVLVDFDNRLNWFNQHNNIKTPIFVYEIRGEVVAYGYISLYRFGRAAFEKVGEISYYIDFVHHKQGIGNMMMEYLISEARKIDYAHLVAILLACNVKSVALLEKYGFACWGVMPDIADIDGEHFSHLYYGLKL
ncbi:MAG: N-acetyltransferase family protein [Defluviitaleaceae bacterium]|nr:N-acetyltransferase family protein [Defluviitaleaceae bacterium]